MVEMRRVREENLKGLQQKEQEISAITTNLNRARNIEETLRFYPLYIHSI
jgi:hypothetical protein